jgi:hypothetical protein
MADKSRLATQLKELLAAFAAKGVPLALIGGLALAPHKVIRATQDIDFLVDATRNDEVHEALLLWATNACIAAPMPGFSSAVTNAWTSSSRTAPQP